MLKKKIAAGVVALAIFSTPGLVACNPGGSSSDSSSGGSVAAGSTSQPDVACDIPEGNLDDPKIDTSKIEGEITFQIQGLQSDFGGFFKAKIEEFEDANLGVKINQTDQGGGAEFDQTVTAQASNCKMVDVIDVPPSTILALSKSNLLMDYDVKAPGIGDKFVKSIWGSVVLGANDHHTALPWYFGLYTTTYNKEVFKRAGLDEDMPPKTMDELFENVAKVGADGQGDYGIYGSPEWYMIVQLYGMGVNPLNADKTAFNFADNEAAISYVTKLSELYASGAIPKDSLTGEPDPGKAYTDGDLVFGTPNTSFLKPVKKNNETVYQNTGVGPLPTNPGIKPVFEGQYIGVSVTMRSAPLAMKFAEWTTNAENEYAWTHDSGTIVLPAATDALDKLVASPSEIVDDPVFKAVYERAAKAAKDAEAYTDAFYVTGTVKDALIENVNKAIRGEVDPETALKTAQDQMNEKLKTLGN